jgi:glycosyltransferase involved in cell wall biosynthesis
MVASSGPAPLVSVCVPTYNDASFLAESLASISDQTYQDLEIVVSDDASTDATPAIVREMSDPRIRYVRNEENLGQFPNMNRCIELARGELVAIYHSDDVYEPTMVAEEVAFLQAHPEAGAVFTLDSWIDGNGNRYGETVLPADLPDGPCFTLDDLLPVLLRRKNCVLRGPTFMGRASVLSEVGDFEATKYDIAGDLDYYLRVAAAHPIGIVRKPLMRYRQDVTQVSRTYNHLRTFEEHYFAVIDRCLEQEGAGVHLDARSRIEYEFHRCDDRVTRAANHVILHEPAAALDLVRQPFPWATFRSGVTRRKVRVVLMRLLIKLGLRVHAARPLAHLVSRTEYGTWRRP